MTATKTRIIIKDLRLYGRHGVLGQERRVGNEYSVSMTIVYDASQAMVSDSIDDALNYALVVDVVKRVMNQPANLLEHLAMNIATAMLDNFTVVTAGSITVTKITPPVTAQINGGVSFALDFVRQ